MENKNSLISLLKLSLAEVDPRQLFKQSQFSQRLDRPSAVLCWGKAAFSTWEAIRPRRASNLQALVIGPEGGSVKKITPSRRRFHNFIHDGRLDLGPGVEAYATEHPLPGPASFAAGKAILEFFDTARREGCRDLHVFLSGGASSLAWIKPAWLSSQDLMQQLETLYRAPLPIEELNRRRSQLCALKGGGAARWARRLIPGVKITVQVISDVAPYDVEVVGSGPFCDGDTPHEVVADNSLWVDQIVRIARSKKMAVLECRSSLLGDWSHWVNRIGERLEFRLGQEHEGLLIFGGEPQVALPKRGRTGNGGRQSHLAAVLGAVFVDEIASGHLEILCASSDGVDGRSGGAGVFLGQKEGARLAALSDEQVEKAIREMDSGTLMKKIGALIPGCPSGTNVQDAVIVRLI